MFGRRREDPRPPIELIGADPPPPEITQVTVGGEPRPRRRLVLVAVAAVVAIVGVSALVGGDDPDDESARRTTTTADRSSRTSRRVTTSTAPPVTVPFGPVLPVQTGGALLLGSYGSSGWVHLDLDTGARTEVSFPSLHNQIPVGVEGGVVGVSGTATVFQPLPEGEAVELGRAGQIYPASRGSVWLVGGEGPAAAPWEGPFTAELIDIPGGSRRSIEIPLPGDAYVAGSSAESLVVVAGGRVYLFAPDGQIEDLGAGEVLATSRRFVVLSRCDARARCNLSVHEPATGAERPLLGVPTPQRAFGRTAVVSDEGELVIVSFHGPESMGVWITPSIEGDEGAVYELPSYQGEQGMWLPGGQGYVIARSAERDVVRVTVEDGRLVLEPILALDGDRGDFVIVIPP